VWTVLSLQGWFWAILAELIPLAVIAINEFWKARRIN